MCGRYTLATPADELVEAFGVPSLHFEHTPRYNIAPGQSVPILAEDGRGRRMGLLEWGFIPAWKDDPKSGFINARGESVTTKVSFRDAFQRRRCLVPADGFYEWRGGVPYWFHPAAGRVMAFAAIWERWLRPGHEPRHTFAILTTRAGPDVQEVHDRMPVVIPVDDRAAWLARSSAPATLLPLLAPAPAGTLVRHEVSVLVNRTDADDARLVAPV